jgi:hypothetical protein
MILCRKLTRKGLFFNTIIIISVRHRALPDLQGMKVGSNVPFNGIQQPTFLLGNPLAVFGPKMGRDKNAAVRCHCPFRLTTVSRQPFTRGMLAAQRDAS